ncbi:MAG: hypothetical protein LBU42_02360 [Prevotellaceae bacterium]|jgi:prophage antirepressor-like protein|nr:hypothetical protein [Prevotellaceae bacterium]
MKPKNAIKLFENKQVRSVWDDEQEKWYISIVDVIEILTGSTNPRRYWSDLKIKLEKEGSQLYEKIVQLKMQSTDGKFYKTDVADVEQLFRLIQSIPSPKAEPFKQWLAQVARERLEEIDDPEQGIERLMEYYHRKGYSDAWINQRLKSIEVRKELTDEWERRGVQKGQEFAMLTDIVTHGWSGMTTKQYKRFKGLKTENLRDNMTNLELVLNMLAEATTTEISKEKSPATAEENREIARQGGQIAGNTRKEIEAKTGKKVASTLNAKKLREIDIQKDSKTMRPL